MKKKKKINNDDPSINFKLPEELKNWVTEQAENQNKTISNYLRNHIEEFRDGRLYEQEISYYQNTSFVESIDFLQLVTWVFSKKEKRTCVASREQLTRYIETIKRIGTNLPVGIKNEFDKVLVDLIKVRSEEGELYRRFDFSDYSSSGRSFDYDLFREYLLNTLKPYCIVEVP